MGTLRLKALSFRAPIKHVEGTWALPVSTAKLNKSVTNLLCMISMLARKSRASAFCVLLSRLVEAWSDTRRQHHSFHTDRWLDVKPPFSLSCSLHGISRSSLFLAPRPLPFISGYERSVTTASPTEGWTRVALATPSRQPPPCNLRVHTKRQRPTGYEVSGQTR